ncbi:MAG: hypothetical protein IJW77_02345 [Clostridia bacterium]|nr:hypothetical protein [Clostridia bacterium]
MKKLWNKELPVWLNCLHLFCRGFQIAVIGYFAYSLCLMIFNGHTLVHPMLYFFAFIIPGQLYNRIALRYGLKDNRQELKQYNRIYLRSVLIAIGLVTLLVVGTVLYAVYGK